MKEFTAAKRLGVVVANTPTLAYAARGLHATRFGRDLAVIAVAAANPHHVNGLVAFSPNSGLRTKVCGPRTSFGNLAELVLAKAGVHPAPAAIGTGCEQKPLQDLGAGRLDAALMFRTNAPLTKAVRFVPIPDKDNIVVEFSFVKVGASPVLDSFAAYLTSPPRKFPPGVARLPAVTGLRRA